VHLRPEDTVASAFRDKLAMQAEAQERYASIRDKPAEALCGTVVSLQMNAGLMADLPSLPSSGAEGVGLFRTELQFLTRNKVPRRGELAALYARVMDAAGGKRGGVPHARYRVGQGAALHETQEEPNPALGWRAIRVGLDKPGVMRMQLQALIRAAAGRPLTVMFPFIAQLDEFTRRATTCCASSTARRRWAMCCRKDGDRRDAGDAQHGLRAAQVSTRWPISSRSAATT
jgi:phosphotransferase system enzyme I (PtsP)